MTADNALPPPERGVRRRDLPGGMVKLEIVLLPDEADWSWARWTGLARSTTKKRSFTWNAETQRNGQTFRGNIAAEARWPSRADGMVALAESYLAGNACRRWRRALPGHGSRRPGSPGARRRAAGTLDDGTRVSAETLRRVACDCGCW